MVSEENGPLFQDSGISQLSAGERAPEGGASPLPPAPLLTDASPTADTNGLSDALDNLQLGEFFIQ